MTNQNVENQSQNNFTGEQDCVNLFCTTIAELNKIAENQMKALLDIAVIAANSTSSGANGQSAGKENGGFGELAADLKNIVEKINQNSAVDQTENLKQEEFTSRIESALINAIQNSVSLQQELNTLGQAILAKAASLVLTTAKTE